jgi:geranylgeranyl diphosphate synthase, type II
VTSSATIHPDQLKEFESAWRQSIQHFDIRLAQRLQPILEKAPSRLAEAIRYSVLAPGKRLRPLLVIWGGEAVGGKFDDCFPAAVAVELVHTYSLIHDDLPAMDDDDLRRGLPTCHIQFDEATAILAGDALQPMAFEILVEGIHDHRIAQEAILRLAKAAGPTALVGGQADDLRAEKEGGGQELLEAIHARKTGAMIEVSVVLGGLLAGGTPDQLLSLSQYGKAIGQAFQIVDDLLDVTGSIEKLGKRTGKDCQRGKLTYPGIYGVEASRQAATDYTGMAVKIAELFGSRGENLVLLAKHLLERTH